MFLMLVCGVLSITAQEVDFKDLKQVNQESYNRYTSIHTYTYDNELYTGFALSKGKYGLVLFQFKDGKKNGVQRSKYKNGALKGELVYKEGLIISTKMWRKDGSQKSEMHHKDGFRKSQKTWYSNGQLNLKERYRKNGDYRSYIQYTTEGEVLEKGHKLRIQEKHQDKIYKVGKWVYYSKSGEKMRVEFYDKKGGLNKVHNYDAG
jgi:hypothetical protein